MNIVTSTLSRFDIFGVRLPTLNIGGQDRMRTSCGGRLTLIIMLITILFGIWKIQQMLQRANPSVSVLHLEQNENDAYELNLSNQF